ncbi:MAG: NAD/NADP octopine/nopaline dehydrogenase family protein, partial [Phycisphaerae bacterium]|nr:NAD/NADP octopine/nopaline dehydrogenase family protein [Phycisphaerae bacterium]
MKQRRITVMGGGHGARTVSADMSLAGHIVTLFEYEQFHANVATIFETQTIEISGKARQGAARLHRTTHDAAEAIEGAELIIIVVPSLVHRIYAQTLAPHLRDGQHVVLVPGTMGSLEFIAEVRKQGCRADITVSELDTLPYATRIQGPASVRVYHNLTTFGLGVFPSEQTDEVFDIFKDLYPGVFKYRDALEVGLSNCNPIIHPLGVLMNAGRIEYSRGEFWYYEEGITPSTARAMETMDDERIAIGKKLSLDLPRQSEALHAVGYGPKGDLWEVLKGSKGLTPIKGPTSVSNRYVTEDIPIGLVCWSQLGETLGVATPLMRATVELGIAVAGVNYWETGRTLQRCGIDGMTAEQLIRYVQTGKG